MTQEDVEEHQGEESSPWSDAAWLVVALALTLPWLCMRGTGMAVEPLHAVVASGLSIVGAAFLLSWSAELAQLEMPRAMATILLALVAVLPEYAVDLYYSWGAGLALKSWTPGTPHPIELGLPMANMTGSNRLLIGLGWSMVVFAVCWRRSKPRLELEEGVGLDLTLLLLSTLYAFVIVAKGTLSMLDFAVYIALFLLYVSHALSGPVEEPELEGPAARIGKLATGPRRVVTGLMFALAAVAIYAAAEPFAEGLKHVGHAWGCETFLLVQWLAPLASESPEFLVAGLLAWRGATSMGLGALVSSKVNQWTLLVGMIPLAVCVASGGTLSLPLDERQRQELLLTTAQSAFALVLLGDLTLSVGEAMGLGATFLLQFAFNSGQARVAFSVAYIVVAVLLLAARKPTRDTMIANLRRHLPGGGG